MIFSLLIRNYKVYKGWNYIPISMNNHFNALIGENGVGKSSVLEALETFFSNPLGDWNYNHTIQKSGFDREPEICPIFIIEKNKINRQRNLYKYLEVITNYLMNFDPDNYHNSHFKVTSHIYSHINSLKHKIPDDIDKYFLFPFGYKKETAADTEFTLSIFGLHKPLTDELCDDADMDDILAEINSFVRDEIEFIYIPSEIDYQTYTKIEGKAIQALMGKSVHTIIRGIIDENMIKNINNGLDSFLKEVEESLEKYEYKKPAKRQTLFNLTHLTSKIIETYFESKILNLKTSHAPTPINFCSSGEKRKAVIDLAEAFILKSERDLKSKTVILAIDEPEVSLHTSSCFDQFEKLENISNHKVQTLISTHWYGFFPSVRSGCATYITNNENENEKECFFLDLSRYREDIKQIVRDTKGEMPNNIELKSINDTVQSVISSITSSKTNWIICEGVSDKIYINHFFKNEKDIKILSVGGSKYVKKFHEYLYLAIEEDKESIKGKVFLLLDTDKNYESYSHKNSLKKISLKRIQNSIEENKVKLLETTDNNYYPPTVIENTLNAKVFQKTIHYFKENGYSAYLNEVYIDESHYDGNAPSGIAFDYKESQKSKIDEFFKKIGTKVKFAEKYSQLDIERESPPWIEEINTFFKS